MIKDVLDQFWKVFVEKSYFGSFNIFMLRDLTNQFKDSFPERYVVTDFSYPERYVVTDFSYYEIRIF